MNELDKLDAILGRPNQLPQSNNNKTDQVDKLNQLLGIPQKPQQSPNAFLNYLSNLQSEYSANRDAFISGEQAVTHGMMQPFLEGSYGQNKILNDGTTLAEASQNFKTRREQSYENAKKINPVTSRLFYGAGLLGGTIPALAGYEGLTAVAPEAVGNILSNPWVSNPILGATLGGSQYVDNNSWRSRGINSLVGGLLGAVFPTATYLGNRFGDAINPTMQTLANKLMGPADMAQTMDTLQAGRNIGVNLRPDEASGNPLVVKNSAAFGKSNETNKIVNANIQTRYAEDKASVNKFLNTLSNDQNQFSVETPQIRIKNAANQAIEEQQKALSNTVQPLYDKAYQQKISPKTMKGLMNQDGTIENAITEAQTSPTYRADMEGFAPNSIKVLDRAKRIIDDKIQAEADRIYPKKNSDLLRVLTDSKKRLTSATDSLSNTYKEARQTYSDNVGPLNDLKNGPVGKIADTKNLRIDNLSRDIFNLSPKQLDQARQQLRPLDPAAWDANVRDYIQYKLRNSGGSGYDLYKNVLKNKDEFNKLIIATRDTPGATSWLNDANKSFANVSNPLTARTVRGYAATGVDQPRLGAAQLGWKEWVKNALGSKMDKTGTSFITNPNWEKVYLSSLKTAPPSIRNQMLTQYFLTPVGTTAAINFLSQ